MGIDRHHHTARQPHQHDPRWIGRTHHLVDGNAHRARQRLPAPAYCCSQAGPAGGNELFTGFAVTLGQAHLTTIEVTTSLVATAIQRVQHLLTEAATLLQHQVEGFPVRGLDLAQGRVMVSQPEQVMGNKTDIVERGLILGHTGSAPVS